MLSLSPPRPSLCPAIVGVIWGMTFSGGAARGETLEGFVTRHGDQLIESDKPFRFISFNIPNLQIVEDNFALDARTAWRWPNEFELTDALESVRQMGGTVVRTYVLSVRREGSDMGEFVHVRGPGDFNEEAFRALDLALDIAGRNGIRVIIPLVDNWKWHGGRGEYAAFRGKAADDFWTDEQVVADFETTVRFVLSRVNTRTGVAYRDDPAILGWETGNELDSLPAWTRRIAALLKELDPNHLVIDGNSLRGLPLASLDDPNVDVITTHHYPNNGGDYVPRIVEARRLTRGKKAYFVGEFGFVPADEIARVYDAVIDNDVSGALLWSLRYHHRDGGFYWHDEPQGGKLYKAYHWPGFDSGEAYGERPVMKLTREKAYKIRGLEPPRLESPAPPNLLRVRDAAAISWQGSAGAQDYRVERANAEAGPWQTIAERVDAAAVQYRPLYNDGAAEPRREYFYRVSARNAAGYSAPSQARGPVVVQHRTLVDEGADLTQSAGTTGDVQPTTGEDRRRREDVHRLAIPAGGAVTYRVDEPIAGWRAIVFRRDAAAAIGAALSSDGREFVAAENHQQTTDPSAGDYDYLPMAVVEGAAVPPGMRQLRIDAAGGTIELSRIEIRYGRVKPDSVVGENRP